MSGPDLSRYVVAENGCHNWTGHIDRDGYGHAGKHFGTNIAHRLARRAEARKWETLHV